MEGLFLTSLVVREQAGIPRVDEPVRVGIPFPRGVVVTTSKLVLCASDRVRTPLQTQVLMRWSDDSVQWALLEFDVTAGAYETSAYELCYSNAEPDSERGERTQIVRSGNSLVVKTGPAEFSLNARVFKPFEGVTVHGVEVLEKGACGLSLVDPGGIKFEPKINDITVEMTGAVRTVLRIVGSFRAKARPPWGDFIARLNFYQGKSLVELELTVRNPRAAVHDGGLWDLGDMGSVYIRDLTLQTTLKMGARASTSWTTTPGGSPAACCGSRLEIYQDSSGGRNWRSTNHKNHTGSIPITFKGYRVTVDGDPMQNGDRCVPTVRVHDHRRAVSGAIVEFWQNFPKAVTVQDGSLRMSLFPPQSADAHELQGGEQKTHTLFFCFDEVARSSSDLSWVHARLTPFATPEWYAHSKAIPYLLPRTQEPEHAGLLQMNDLIDSAVRGEDTFFSRREIIDEYGWRNFGDLYADHEAVGHCGTGPRVAHYNNQYDVVYGAAIQYCKGGDPEWFRLMRELARHVIDIDIYHTSEDKAAYNGGLFWHTAHYSDAETATHRTYSRAQVERNHAHSHGGGPSSSHNYTTGLLYYYLLTGDVAASEAVQGLADWVLNMDDGSQRWLGLFDRRPTGLASCSVTRDYHGPGRGSGNSLNALLDAWTLTGREVYRLKLEVLIQRCIHPQDDIAARGLEDVEHRWSYTMFLQSLGKYLDCKAERGEMDFFYGYARDSLLHYARWMGAHEVPYRRVLHQVEIPTESWPAQDIRKSNVFKFAAKYATEAERCQFLRKAEEFFSACITDLLSFPTARLTRPLVLLMTNGFMHPYFLVHFDETGPCLEHTYDFRRPRQFRSQFAELYQLRDQLGSILNALRQARRCLQRTKATV